MSGNSAALGHKHSCISNEPKIQLLYALLIWEGNPASRILGMGASVCELFQVGNGSQLAWNGILWLSQTLSTTASPGEHKLNTE